MSSTLWQFPREILRLPRRLSATAGGNLQGRVRRWAKRRQGSDPHRAELHARRVYILPTGVGVMYGLMLFAMLLGSMNYNNNLSFGLTFLLVALGLVAMHFCQRTLVGLEVAFAGVEPAHAGRAARFRVSLVNRSRSYRMQLQLYSDEAGSEIVDLAPGASETLILEVPTHSRGYVTLPRFGVQSRFPFELFRSWAWLHMDLSALVYPAILQQVPDPPPSRTDRGHRQHDAAGEEDFAGLRHFVDGDSPRHVAWKAYARSGELLAKRFSGADTSSQWLDFDRLPGADVETRLSTLTRWIIDAEREQRDYGLRLPGQEFPPAHGEEHRHRCLKALALYDGATAS